MTDASPNEVVRASANRLYWNSADTVDDIAGRLGIGRSALYGAIRPAPAGADCARCGAAMVFANRSARAAGRARCPECGSSATLGAESHPLERPAEPAPAPRARAAASPRAAAGPRRAPARSRPRRRPAAPPAPPARDWSTALASVEPRRALMIGGAALLGVALGAAAVDAVRRWS